MLCPERMLFDMQVGTWFVETIHCQTGVATQRREEGQRPRAPRQQAGHKTASDKTTITAKKVLQGRSHPHRTERKLLFPTVGSVFDPKRVLTSFPDTQHSLFLPAAMWLCHLT